jgi:hypothetical protein
MWILDDLTPSHLNHHCLFTMLLFVVQACSGGGAGSGPGGRPTLADGTPNPYENCQPLGNILVIQESDKSCPDDSWAGGWLQFDFRVPTEVLFAKLLDIDEGKKCLYLLGYCNVSISF